MHVSGNAVVGVEETPGRRTLEERIAVLLSRTTKSFWRIESSPNVPKWETNDNAS